MTMQIKMKPGKPTEPGDYLCIRNSIYTPEYFRVERFREDGLIVRSVGGLFLWDSIEDEALFSERIKLVIEE